MSREMTLMIIPIYRSDDDSVEQVSPKLKKLRHYLEITTETDLIKLPIEAEIATANEFRNMFRGNLEAGKHKSVRILSVRPSSTRSTVAKPIPNNYQSFMNEFKIDDNESYETQDDL